VHNKIEYTNIHTCDLDVLHLVQIVVARAVTHTTIIIITVTGHHVEQIRRVRSALLL